MTEVYVPLYIVFEGKRLGSVAHYKTPHDSDVQNYLLEKLQEKEEEKNICLDAEQGTGGVSDEEKRLVIYTRKKDNAKEAPSDEILNSVLFDLRLEAFHFEVKRQMDGGRTIGDSTELMYKPETTPFFESLSE
ncbi:hypothetical protein COEREDRAFT_85955 [Coemansia reversa NRRL 1564]|uniref:Uncharacterized protein n=1 Tax=Coemansia reversa (strain ATCC 12441 / NRRL 1564) TaxID=763665 RepID=A0A2G5BG46_COERN|nr:hypothetical protein COEREDRAFT_85955 [Coemansia reversa NRRL 1564]|eukprot:PIA17687.1 hypothetical protein COEREDRAFT_85955 [Coemansia reversa NRRL 1564]